SSPSPAARRRRRAGRRSWTTPTGRQPRRRLRRKASSSRRLSRSTSTRRTTRRSSDGAPRRPWGRIPSLTSLCQDSNPDPRTGTAERDGRCMMLGWKTVALAACSLACLALARARGGDAKEHGFLVRVHKDADGKEAKYVLFVPHDYKGDKDYPLILF